MTNFERSVPFLFIAFSIFIAGVFGYTATTRALTGLESSFLQVFTLGMGLTGSFIFGRRSAKESAMEIIKPHARSSFRRVLALYASLSRVSAIINSSKEENMDNYDIILAKLEVIVTEQLHTIDDAVEDWRDMVPEDVEELNNKLVNRNSVEINNE